MRRNHVFDKSRRGGIQDQMNCLEAFMRGYGIKPQESDTGIDTTQDEQHPRRESYLVYRYTSGAAQWRIAQIEKAADRYCLELPDMFKLGRFLYEYCPSYTGSKDDYDRLKHLGRRVKDMGMEPMKAMEMAALQDFHDKTEELKMLAQRLGIKVEITCN